MGGYGIAYFFGIGRAGRFKNGTQYVFYEFLEFLVKQFHL